MVSDRGTVAEEREATMITLQFKVSPPFPQAVYFPCAPPNALSEGADPC